MITTRQPQGIEAQRQLRLLSREDASRTRGRGEPGWRARQAHRQVVVNVWGIECGGEADARRRVLDAHRGGVRGRSHAQVLVADVPVRIQDGLEGVRTARPVVEDSGPGDDEARAVEIGGDQRTRNEQIVPERCDQVGGRT